VLLVVGSALGVLKLPGAEAHSAATPFVFLPAPPGSGQFSLGQVARRLFGQPFAGSKLERFLEIDVTGLPVTNPAPNIFLIPGTDPLDVANRIVRSGCSL
jgi:hypothetical protein